MVDDALLHKDGLHVLPADVEDETHLRTYVARRHVVGDGFNDAAVQSEGHLDEVFAITG